MTMTMPFYGCGTVERNYIARDHSNLVILCSFIFMRWMSFYGLVYLSGGDKVLYGEASPGVSSPYP